MHRRSNSYINKNYLKQQLVLLVVIVCYVSSLTITFGRYVVSRVATYITSSKEFYFYSDKLEDRNIEYPISWSGTEECIIPINLYSKMNSLKTATHDIKYKVEYEMLSSNAKCTLSKESGVISADTNNDAFSVALSPNTLMDEDDKMRVRINVTTVDDFEKTLTATFVISLESENVSYTIDDEANRPYFNLIINNMQKENITISFDPNEVVIDTTSDVFGSLSSYELLDGTNYVNKIEFVASALSNYNIKFYKKDKSKDYTEETSVIKFEHEEI